MLNRLSKRPPTGDQHSNWMRKIGNGFNGRDMSVVAVVFLILLQRGESFLMFHQICNGKQYSNGISEWEVREYGVF